MREIKSEQEMEDFAREIAEKLAERGRGKTARAVGLSGELGAGKTAFMKALARVLGIADTVISPTFVLERVYDVPKVSVFGGVFDRLVHIDAYRLESAGELEALGYSELTKNPKHIIFIEWPEQLKEALPEDALYIKFEHVDEETRKVEVGKS